MDILEGLAFELCSLWHLPLTHLRAVLSRLRSGTPAEFSQGAGGLGGKTFFTSHPKIILFQTAREELGSKFMVLKRPGGGFVPQGTLIKV